MSKFKESFQKIHQKADEVWQKWLAALLQKYGVEMTNSPRDLQAHLLEIIPKATKINMVVDVEELFLFELPRAYTPDTWDDLIEMMRVSMHREGKGIQIIKPPIGTASQISEAWVGLTLPFSSRKDYYPLLFVTPELAAIGLHSSDRKGYMIDSQEGIAILEKSNPQAAEAYKHLRPHWADEGQILIFDGDSSQVVEI